MSFLLAALVLWILPASVQDPSSPAIELLPGAERCPDCDGAGDVEAACESCDGQQIADCPSCTHEVEDWRPDPRILRIQSFADQASKTRKKKLEDLVQSLWVPPTLGFTTFRPEEHEPGTVECPEACKFDEAPDDCRKCDGAQRVECESCEGSARVECIVCDEGTARSPCHTCRGHGQVVALDVLEEADLQSCPFCELAPTKDCGTCGGSQKMKGSCADCQGLKKITCRHCEGATSLRCVQCFGLGVEMDSLGDSKRKKCKECRGKRATRCKECSKGLAKCASCVGGASKRVPCSACTEGYDDVVCYGCLDDLSLSWRRTAERAFEAKRPELANRLLAVALEREENYLAALDELNSLTTGAGQSSTHYEDEAIRTRAALREIEALRAKGASDSESR